MLASARGADFPSVFAAPTDAAAPDSAGPPTTPNPPPTAPSPPPPIPMPATGGPATGSPGPTNPPSPPATTGNAPNPNDNEFAFAGLPSGGAANASAPYMIGDFFVGGGQIFLSTETSQKGQGQLVGQIPSAGGSGFVKVSENNSVFPADRVFFDYNGFENAIFVPMPNAHILDVDRYTPGIEKTFFDGHASVELRIPFANTQSSDVNLQGKPNNSTTEFGDLELTFKYLVFRTDNWAMCAGVAFTFPTAADTRIYTSDSTFTIENQSTNVQPYIGLLFTPSDRCFVQTFVAFDIPTTANNVLQSDVGKIGALRDQALLFVDIEAGYWLYRNPQARWITALGPVIEYHYTSAIQDAGLVTATSDEYDVYTFGNSFNRFDIHNLTVGMQSLIGRNSSLTVSGVLPLDELGSPNRQFDAEALVEFNRFY